MRIALVAVLLSLGAAAQQPEGGRAPNIVYVVADELGYFETSYMGNKNLKTPNLDRMAAEGMRFTQYLAGSAVCAPTRACLLTGKHSGHTSVRSNGGGTPLRADETTVAEVLQAKGYATGGFGKWGCGGRGSTGVPERHGFDEFVGYYDQVHAHSYYPAYLVENGNELPLPGNVGGRSGETYSHYVIWERAMRFVKENAKAGKPFFCYLPITPPHGLFDIPDTDPAWAQFKDAPWPMEARRYAAMVAMVDRQVGELVALLRETGVEANTLVLFSGDNGGADYFADKAHPRGIHGANVDPRTGVEFRGNKGQLYEGGLRVPMLARWPGKIPAGTVAEHLCYFPDFLPTAAAVAGAEVPAGVDGISMLPTLLGKAAEQSRHEYLYWEIGGQTAVRAGDWKLIRTGPRKPWELYDLASDLSEAKDVAAQRPEVVAKLAAFAEQAHTPVVEGTFERTDLHEKDRQAKWGEAGEPKPNKRAGKAKQATAQLPTEGMLSRDGWRVQRVSSESGFNGKLAACAFDGDPSTIWHTQWRDELAEHPHELVIDFGASRTVRGLALLARQDEGWNGTPSEIELTFGDDADDLVAAPVRTTFGKVKTAQVREFAAQTGRYVRIRVLSEVGGGPWAAIAELGFLAN